MAKKIQLDNIIAAEVEELADKVKEFQKYLKINNILTTGSGVRYDEVEEEVQEKLHKEILVQIKMQDAVFNWLPMLKKLRETEAVDSLETRGNVEVNGMFKKNAKTE